MRVFGPAVAQQALDNAMLKELNSGEMASPARDKILHLGDPLDVAAVLQAHLVEDDSPLHPTLHAGQRPDPGQQRCQATAVAAVLAEEAVNRLPPGTKPIRMTRPQVPGDPPMGIGPPVAAAGSLAWGGQQLAAIAGGGLI